VIVIGTAMVVVMMMRVITAGWTALTGRLG
jgi:hypothetical protein